MSITDELREYIDALTTLPITRSNFIAIANRIDAEHERTLGEWDYWESTHVKLPVDADGVPVSIGDVMVYSDGNACPMRVVALVPPSVFLTDDGPRYADMCRHKPTTVEDMLLDMHMKLDEVTALYVNDAIDSDERDRDEARIFAEYAAKLQLREVDE